METDEALNKWLGRVARRGSKAIAEGYPTTVGRLYPIAQTILRDDHLARQAIVATYRFIQENAKDLRDTDRPLDRIAAQCRRIALDMLDQTNLPMSQAEYDRIVGCFSKAPVGCESQYKLWSADTTKDHERHAFIITYFLAYSEKHFDASFAPERYGPLIKLEEFVVNLAEADGSDQPANFAKEVIHCAVGLTRRQGESDQRSAERNDLELRLAPMLSFLPEEVPEPPIQLDGQVRTQTGPQEVAPPRIDKLEPVLTAEPAKDVGETPTVPNPGRVGRNAWKPVALTAMVIAAVAIGVGVFLFSERLGDDGKGVVTATGADLYGLAASQGAGSFMVLIDSIRGRLHVRPVGVQALESDRLLLWLESDGDAPRLVGRLAVGEGRHFTLADISPGDRVFVTLENENADGDSPSKPGGPPLYLGTVEAAID